MSGDRNDSWCSAGQPDFKPQLMFVLLLQKHKVSDGLNEGVTSCNISANNICPDLQHWVKICSIWEWMDESRGPAVPFKCSSLKTFLEVSLGIHLQRKTKLSKSNLERLGHERVPPEVLLDMSRKHWHLNCNAGVFPLAEVNTWLYCTQNQNPMCVWII